MFIPGSALTIGLSLLPCLQLRSQLPSQQSLHPGLHPGLQPGLQPGLARAPIDERDTPSAEQESRTAAPNFLIVLMDDVGTDKLGMYDVGMEPAKTPHLDTLAARGIVFEAVWAYQSCSPTRAALLTGRYSDRTGVGSVIFPNDRFDTPLPFSEHLIPEDLPGYVTTHIGKWHLGDKNEPVLHPCLSGFDHSVRWKGENDYFRWTEYVDGEPSEKTGYFPASMGEHVVRAIHSAESPYFIYYAPRLAHSPFHEPPQGYHSLELPVKFAERQHRAMVEAIDKILGDILAAVDLSTTYVIVLGDNGSPIETIAGRVTGKKFKGTLYEGGIRVPFLVAGPGVAQGARCDELVSVTDIFATVRELSGLGPPSRGAEDSVSFASLLKDPSGPATREYLYVRRFPLGDRRGRRRRTIRTKRWKLTEDLAAKTSMLFDLQQDPGENVDLAERAASGKPEDESLAKVAKDLHALFPSFGPLPDIRVNPEPDAQRKRAKKVKDDE